MELVGKGANDGSLIDGDFGNDALCSYYSNRVKFVSFPARPISVDNYFLDVPMFTRFCIVLFLFSLVSLPGQADTLSQAVSKDYDRHLGDLFEWFHRNPELSMMEHSLLTPKSRQRVEMLSKQNRSRL